MDLKEKKLLTLKEMCSYLSISESEGRRLLKRSNCNFSVRLGYRLYANKKLLDAWIDEISGIA